ncbi:Tripartite tricarboxylate transporter TctB family [Saccharomonospora marina XMU15]|uniref:Tripartite tricarboxylate transporter TctB family n=1 Tax=Saccharomonospora marina XMU15 TaxID=882083 RepID=H5WXP5_9PSEU|nr:tripartite tricarboxylate transporter TctB family protein [Saccharomonospora marina]EHR50648.1 Tripartite tricarboxylate transporter TctB family [Saccharomonospora marina XMU15]
MTVGWVRGNADPIAAGALLGLGLLYGGLALDEGLGTIAETGAGFFPLLVAVVLVASSAAVLLRERRRRTDSGQPAAEDGDDFAGTVHWWRVIGVVLAALLVPLLGTTLGMIVTLSISLVLIAKIMGLSRWSSALILGVAFGAATWLIFVYWLYVPLPTGTLGLV